MPLSNQLLTEGQVQKLQAGSTNKCFKCETLAVLGIDSAGYCDKSKNCNTNVEQLGKLYLLCCQPLPQLEEFVPCLQLGLSPARIVSS